MKTMELRLRALARSVLDETPKALWFRCINSFSLVQKLIRKMKGLYLRTTSFYIRRVALCPAWLSFVLPRPAGVRRYISPKVGVLNTFKLMNLRNVRYVVLRWHENLPIVKLGEDIDFLIHDEDIEKVRDLFVWFSKEPAVDLYSISAELGWNDLPYYPPHVSQQLLEGRELFNDHFYIPGGADRFFCLAYHAVIHKGLKSGLAADNQDLAQPIADHDYFEALKEAQLDETTGELSLNGIWRMLEKKSWLPQEDSLSKLAEVNEWLQGKLEPIESTQVTGELMLFVVRSEAKIRKVEHLILDWFDDHYYLYTPVLVHRLDRVEKDLATQFIRGGEWGKGCFNESGGEPELFIFVYDYAPLAPDSSLAVKQPRLSNQHYDAKHYLRAMGNRQQLFTSSCNFLHSPDNEREVRDYIDNCLEPETVSQINELSNRHRERCSNPAYPVVQRLSTYGTRAKVELIEYDDRRAIKKTFKLGQERFLQREVFAYTELAKQTRLIPGLLEHGEGYLVVEHVEAVAHKKFEAGHAEQIVSFLKLVYDAGYFLTDLHPQNILINSDGELRFFDFEFLQAYEHKPEKFEQSYDITGVPNEIEIDFPRKYDAKKASYAKTWEPLLGPLSSHL